MMLLRIVFCKELYVDVMKTSFLAILFVLIGHLLMKVLHFCKVNDNNNDIFIILTGIYIAKLQCIISLRT